GINANLDVSPNADAIETEIVHQEAPKDGFPIRVAYFVIMGGFAIDPADAIEALPLTFTPNGFIEWYRTGLIKDEDFNILQVDDKSKASIMGKAIVCGQAAVR